MKVAIVHTKPMIEMYSARLANGMPQIVYHSMPSLTGLPSGRQWKSK